ncbi:MAG: ABC transporter permease subunit, partial [Acidobacteria bacterium]|nr:ABC transporter permease subunit [Acidobacteriota bacterium]
MIIRTVIAKEIRDILGSSRFAVTFAVCAVLILLSFFLGARGYRQNLARYEAARAENLRQMEGLTSWLEVRHNRIFLPPSPLESLVKGVSDDIGRTVEVRGRGELIPEGSRFNEEPILATFRFLDLEFIFQVVLSLLAILFAFDAVSGEKERGTLRLALSGSFRRHEFLVGKIGGAFIALSIPLLLAILLGFLLMTVMGVHLSGPEWLRLGLVILLGLLYFGAFVSLAVCVSSLTRSSAQSFLVLLALWVLAVVVIP